MENPTSRLNRIMSALLICMVVLIALPYMLGAVALINQAINTTSKPDALKYWQSAIFVQGLAIGIYGAAISLMAVSQRLRKLGLAGVLLGSAGITFAMLIARVMDNNTVSPLPFMLPSTLAISALVLGYNSVRRQRPESESETGLDINEEQQSPLSQP